MTKGASVHAAVCIGCDAAATLSHAAGGTIAAVFARSFYLRFGENWICLGGEEIGAGPLNVLCNWLKPPDWRTVVETGQYVSWNGEFIALGEDRKVATADAQIWRPSLPASPDHHRACRSLELVERHLQSGIPDDGLGSFIFQRPAPPSRTSAAALPAIEALEKWIRCGATSSPPEKTALDLLGLGPGLTPSGDDFLAGTLCTLRAVGRADAADSLWRFIDAASLAATAPISRAHLESAARGYLAADLHSLLDALWEGEATAISDGLHRIKQRDHYSPWDCLAGIAVTLRAAVKQPRVSDNPRPSVRRSRD